VRVQNDSACDTKLISGLISQTLTSPPFGSVASKFAAAYEFAAPLCAENTPGLPWNQLVAPTGLLALTMVQPLATRLSKFSVSVVGAA
jgi:hypothetical protein